LHTNLFLGRFIALVILNRVDMGLPRRLDSLAVIEKTVAQKRFPTVRTPAVRSAGRRSLKSPVHNSDTGWRLLKPQISVPLNRLGSGNRAASRQRATITPKPEGTVIRECFIILQ
jgi:hypothetical protein